MSVTMCTDLHFRIEGPRLKNRKTGKPSKVKRSRAKRPEVVETKATFWCRSHNRMEPKSAFHKSFLKRGDHRCKAAYSKYAKARAKK